MKFQTIRNAFKIRLLAVAVLATCAFAVPGYAQSSIAAKFSLPYEVHWGKNVLPPGDYAINMDLPGPVALVQSSNGKTSFLTPIPIKQYNDKGHTALFVVVRGNERFVRSLNLPMRGISLIYQPTTPAEREMLAQSGRVEQVRVITAGK